MLDKYPLAVRPFYTMPDPNDKVCKSLNTGIHTPHFTRLIMTPLWQDVGSVIPEV